jgi:hypothetical protein
MDGTGHGQTPVGGLRKISKSPESNPRAYNGAGVRSHCGGRGTKSPNCKPGKKFPSNQERPMMHMLIADEYEGLFNGLFLYLAILALDIMCIAIVVLSAIYRKRLDISHRVALIVLGLIALVILSPIWWNFIFY